MVKAELHRRGISLESTAKAELQKHKDDPFIALLLKHREMSKLQNAFIKPFLELPTLPSVHTRFGQILSTGRLSSSEPNLQQIPSRTENGKLLRRLFVARPGRVLVIADYSQIELRVMAHYSKDPILMEAYRNGEDIHEKTSKALGVDRFWGKTANFSIGYGCSKWKLASLLGTTPELANEFINAYWKQFRVLRSWRYRVIEDARRKGGITTLAGRWIPVLGLNESDFRLRGAAEREAVSYLVQGSAADVMKLAMLACHENGFTPQLSVHDEMLFEVQDQQNADLIADPDFSAIRDIMEHVVKLDVPLEVKVSVGANWGVKE